MLVYLLRHGRACPVGSPGVHSDEQRFLTTEGQHEIRTAIRASAGSLVRPGRLLHSPYVRAQQSAVLLAEGMGFQGHTEEHPGLVPHGDPDAFLSELSDAAAGGLSAIALVGHEPFMGRMLAILLTGEPRASIPFATGMLAAVQLMGSASMVGQLVFARAP